MGVAADAADEGAVYNIGTAARKSGLSVTTIRTWEDRYAAVIPVRDGSGRRLYSSDQITQLTWLRQQIDAGLRASEAHRLLVSGEMEPVGSSVLVDQGSAWTTMLAWADQERAWIDSVLADLRRGLRAEATAMAVLLDNPIAGPVLSLTSVDCDGEADELGDLAVVTVRGASGLEEALAAGEPQTRARSELGSGGSDVTVAPIQLGGSLAGALLGVAPEVSDPAIIVERAVRVIESRIEADRARSAFSNLLD